MAGAAAGSSLFLKSVVPVGEGKTGFASGTRLRDPPSLQPRLLQNTEWLVNWGRRQDGRGCGRIEPVPQKRA